MENDISAIITVYNKKNTVSRAVKSLMDQTAALREIFIIDDGSTDGSKEVIRKLAAAHANITPVFQEHCGIAGSLNKGISLSKGEFVIVLDGDVILEDGWLGKLMPCFKDTSVAAASGVTRLANDRNLWALLGGYSAEYRQSKIKSPYVDHLSTCNTIYRRASLNRAGLFDPAFHYGQDNDLSYRLIAAGYKLALRKDAGCLHFWPETIGGFLRQRFNGAVGRMRLIKKHPGRWKGDMVSDIRYFAGVPQLGEIMFFIKRKKAALGLFLPFFYLLRTCAWMAGVFYENHLSGASFKK
ncbi:MAG: glycosyltransferase [Candidatus Omnitrophica bacterium]|nr:glycosyltransferase [Candidatus Omnitrophota bacterium]